MNTFTLTANLVDIPGKRTWPAHIAVENGRIRSITPAETATGYVLPGFVDAHVHVESSMLIPSEFARLAVVHGTVATVSDPHEIANVLGVKGVEYMLDNGKQAPFKFWFGAPSCVPATVFETAGAAVTAEDVDQLLQRPDVVYLSEMMNSPGVLMQDPEVMQKIASAQKYGKPVDGHAPGLRGEDARRYIAAGISTDHECFTAEEALDKLQYGMKILIREGSAARNFEVLAPLLNEHYANMMFCSDDKHPDNLVEGHIDVLVKRALAKGIDVYKVLQVACINPVQHYKLDVGLLQIGDPADFIVVDDLQNFAVQATYINGQKVAEGGQTLIPSVSSEPVNYFHGRQWKPSEFRIPAPPDAGDYINVKVIEALDGQLITNTITAELPVINNFITTDVAHDVLKIAVVNRYKEAPAAIGFIRNFGLQEGAIASSVAHDSHNIIVVGVNDEDICDAVNEIIRDQGGVTVTLNTSSQTLPLPVAGLMSTLDGYEVARRYSELDAAAKALGSTLEAPFMTLSFMALLVIPHLKLSDLGLFDGDTFSFTEVY
jgi:adenine deaminase